MKRIFPILIVIVSMASYSCDSEKVVSESKLPDKISNYIATHFPENTVNKVTKERDDFKTTYDVLLDNYVTLEFNSDNDIREIEGYSKLPDSVIPDAILSYTLENYPDQAITSWALDDGTQEIELDNQIQLIFSADGIFLGFDD